jgi:DNA-binding MarR family transcriptional regulator
LPPLELGHGSRTWTNSCRGSNIIGSDFSIHLPMSRLQHMSRKAVMKTEARLAPHPQEQGLGVGHLMGRARASLLAGLDAELARFGLNGMQFAVLKHLGEGAARTAADLCRFMHHDTGAMTRILDRLEQKGLVRRERCREDRRVVYLRMTANGRAQLPRFMAAGTHVLEAHLAGFSHAEVGQLKAYLERMIDNGRDAGDTQQSAAGGKP